MNKYHKHLEEYAEAINRHGEFLYEIHINRRNGYYAIDIYTKEGKYAGYCKCGLNYHETLLYLQGMLEAYYNAKPF